MIKILAFTLLKLHFENEQKFSPVEVNAGWQLQSSLSVLCGMRGNIITFTRYETAAAWIESNLAKVAKTHKTSDDFLLDLIIEQNTRPQPYLAREIEVIEARNAGDWSVYFADELVEKFELGYFINAAETQVSNEILIDGGNANSIYL